MSLSRNFNQTIMKTKLIKSSVLLVVFALGGLSCSKSDTSPAVSQEDAADAVGSYLASDFSSSTSDAASVSTQTGSKAGGRSASGYRTEASSCGVAFDSTLSKSSPTGSLITYSYQLTYTYTLACTNKIPSSLDLGITSTGTYSGPRISSTGSGAGSWAITEFTGTTYSLNGSYSKTETVTQKTGAQKEFSNKLDLTYAGIAIDKSTKKLTGGTITYTMTGAITGGASFNYSGTITFLGNESATITVGSATYTVDLSVGTVTKS